jgi:hypothetical protein
MWALQWSDTIIPRMSIETVVMSEGLAFAPASMPWTPLVSLMLVFVASTIVFVALTRRWTSHRSSIALQDWARQMGYQLVRRYDARMPAVLAGRIDAAQLRWLLVGKATSLVQFDLEGVQWNALLRQTGSHRTSGLRPTKVSRSLVDFWKLSTFPALGGQERFTMCAGDLLDARRLARSHLPALLPPDVGLILQDQQMVLDFSARPFDPTELSRMLALADQLEKLLAT